MITWKNTLACLALLISCSSSKQVIQLQSDTGKSRIVHPNIHSTYTIGIDSSNVDSAICILVENALWKINNTDAEQQTIEFIASDQKNQKINLHKSQIRFLKVHVENSERFTDQMTSVFVFTGFIVGSMGVLFGVFSLPIPSTPWREDLDLLGRGAGILGLTLLVGYLSEDQNQYKIIEIH
jgi:hypothetical protein